jgi:DMSO/TMAO reductase YedYZ molybdopterin-dependent catalytic subunit
MSWRRSALAGAVASLVALLLQNVIRETWQIRTLPERVMEWLLLFIPLDLFERGLAQFGANAKELALDATFIGMALMLVVIGTLLLHAGWPGWRLLAVSGLLWLLTMALVMPVTGAGFFATGLLIDPLLTNLAYLLVFLAYATVLVCARVLSFRTASVQALRIEERRALLGGLIATFAALGAARIVGRNGGLVASSLPPALAPTAAPTPTAVPVAASAPTEATSATAVPRQPAPTPTLEPLPNPPPPRQLARDQDGSLTAAGRPKGQLAPPITDTNDFYVVTKNAVADPNVDIAAWRLVIDGEVNQPVQVDFRTLRALPTVEITKTLECISNFTTSCELTTFGCDLLSTARWNGARLSDVLALAGGLKSTVHGLAFVSADEFSAGLPPDVVDDPDTLVVYEMNGQPLPREHGFPARLLVPGRYGMKNPKWLAGIRAMTQPYAGWYEQRNWSKDGIVETMARIDVPLDGVTLPAGEQQIAGIAYAGDRGMQMVEFSTDNSHTWHTAQMIEPMPGRDAMVRWQGTFSLSPGTTAVLVVRATDGTGTVQTDEFSLPQPDGATGRHSITVHAAA